MKYPKYKLIEKPVPAPKGVVEIDEEKLLEEGTLPTLMALCYRSKLDGCAYWLPCGYDWQIVKTENGGTALVPTLR